MIEVTVVNCDEKEVQYMWSSKEAFVKDMDSENENIPMFDDILTAVDTDDKKLASWWRYSGAITVGELYERCKGEKS